MMYEIERDNAILPHNLHFIYTQPSVFNYTYDGICIL